MRKLLLISLLTALTACTSSTPLGPCIGAFDDKDPTLVYHADGGRILRNDYPSDRGSGE